MSDSSSDEGVIVFRGWRKKSGEEVRDKQAGIGHSKQALSHIVLAMKEGNIGEILASQRCQEPGSEVCVMREGKQENGISIHSERSTLEPSPIREEVERAIVNHTPPSKQAATSPSSPTPRPLSEPPQFNYDRFMRHFIPSEKRVRILFPNDIERRTRCKDLVAEHEALKEYPFWTSITNWATMMVGTEEASSSAYIAPEGFCGVLMKELEFDALEVGQEVENLYASTTDDLAKWEYEHLDNDGKTTRIEEELDMIGSGRFARRRDIFSSSERARKKYGYLCTRSLARWEAQFLDDKRSERKTSGILTDLIAKRDIFVGCEEARTKYEHVVEPTLEQWKHCILIKMAEYLGFETM